MPESPKAKVARISDTLEPANTPAWTGEEQELRKAPVAYMSEAQGPAKAPAAPIYKAQEL